MTDQTAADDARTRATQLGELLEVAEHAGNTAEALRVEFVADNERLRATLAAVTALAFDATLRPDVRLSRIRNLLDPADNEPSGCPHVSEGGCCHGPGYCCHACEPDPQSLDESVQINGVKYRDAVTARAAGAFSERAEARVAALDDAADQLLVDANLRATEGETDLAEYGRELAELIQPKEES